MALEDEIKAAVASDKAIIGTKEVLKAIKEGRVKKVVMSSNTPESVMKDVSHYQKMAEIDVRTFGGTGKQLGVFCGKPFGISVMAIRK
ncbi:MAG: 50S ribosomal protein L30e [Candidatus Aenigmatarchaeota archaeon]